MRRIEYQPGGAEAVEFQVSEWAVCDSQSADLADGQSGADADRRIHIRDSRQLQRGSILGQLRPHVLCQKLCIGTRVLFAGSHRGAIFAVRRQRARMGHERSRQERHGGCIGHACSKRAPDKRSPAWLHAVRRRIGGRESHPGKRSGNAVAHRIVGARSSRSRNYGGWPLHHRRCGHAFANAAD